MWTSVDRSQAAETIARFLYQPIPFAVDLMRFPRSRAFATAFLEAFTVDARFVTNLTDPPAASGWSPVTPHTFDAFAIAMDHERVGLLCVADED